MSTAPTPPPIPRCQVHETMDAPQCPNEATHKEGLYWICDEHAAKDEPCPEDLVPGDPSIPCALKKGHQGPHQDRVVLPVRRWT